MSTWRRTPPGPARRGGSASPAPPLFAGRSTWPLHSNHRAAADIRPMPREYVGTQAEWVWLHAAALPPGCPLIAVSSADGGVGRSTLVAALGGLLALASPALVAAADLTGRAWGGLAHRVAATRPGTVWDAVAAATAGQPGLVPQFAQPGPTGLHTLIGEPHMNADRHPPSYGEAQTMLAALPARYGLALLDLRPADNGGTWRALASAAAPVLVGRATEDSLQHLLTVLAWMRTAGLSAAADRCVVAVMTTSPVISRDTRAVQRQVEQTAGHVVRIGYDPILARPHPIDVRGLHKATRTSLTDLAAAVLRRCTGPAPVTALGPVTPVPPAAPLPPAPPAPRPDEQ
ncbi:MinD-like ATPase involved in chromosome partitioning or flagellar assembly [Catenuloplanes nepalensis]|uniref:MinD-like ATPase involved in chromosome partitioning or flagellar assembly n=1 Tax=Catenuloplanes nepalensis TaxID=587533 RepID=A0ABT9MMD3_9ACTN|nr:hypothetical protein [Catenuloplanes nepalensis]MDP9792565.1 MinD-like ATPase involved in chromosome partitioning or flagellar assembly [Catenuloplanes nepalensis]